VSLHEIDKLEALWDFNDAPASEERFRQFLTQGVSDQARLEGSTQLARALSLQRRIPEAHEILDEIKPEISPRTRQEIRWLLEKGRTLNSSGEPEQAKPLFVKAWQIGSEISEQALAVDAAHMVAIVAESEEQISWNEKALDVARVSSDPKAQKWRASLLNNLGWTYYDLKEFERALGMFQEARELRVQREQPIEERIARYCVAKCLRAMGRVDEALELQLSVIRDAGDGGTAGYPEEEVGECLLLKGETDRARESFKKAVSLFETNHELDQEPARLDRLRRLSAPNWDPNATQV
jgi:tetratricopeptide (TPR) repeat protein